MINKGSKGRWKEKTM
jgi:hypothetical protein